MRKQSILFLLSVSLLLGFVSCGENIKEDVYIPIKSVRATASTLLHNRANWEFYVNGNMYRTTVSGRTIQAQPKSEEEITYFIIYAPTGRQEV